MKDNVSEYLARPKRYDNIDGTGEVFMGLMLLGFFLIGYLQRSMDERSFWMQHGIFFMYAVLAPVLGAGFLLQKFVKRTFTFPRTGYVALGSAEKPVATKVAAWGYGAILGAICALVLCAVMLPLLLIGRKYTFSLEISRFVYVAVFIASYGFWLARTAKAQKWKWSFFAVQSAALVLIALMLPLGNNLSDWFFPWVALSAGVIWILSGIATFAVYLHNHPAAPAE